MREESTSSELTDGKSFPSRLISRSGGAVEERRDLKQLQNSCGYGQRKNFLKLGGHKN